MKHQGPVYEWLRNPSSIATSLQRFGSSLQYVDIVKSRILSGFPGASGTDYLASIYKELGQHTVGLESFGVTLATTGIYWLDLVVKHSTSLEKIRIGSSLPFRNSAQSIAFPANLLELKTLHISGVRGHEDNGLASFLETSGGKLEDVEIDWQFGSASGWLAIIDALRKSCLNARKIILTTGAPRLNHEGNHEWQGNIPKDEVKRLLISYGAQLREAELLYFVAVNAEESWKSAPMFSVTGCFLRSAVAGSFLCPPHVSNI